MSWLRDSEVAGEQLLITAALALVYLITPYQIGVVTYLDMRALHYASLFLICAGVRYAETGAKMQATQLAAASTVAVLNLVYLATCMLPQNAALGDYRRLAREIPADAKVLPIDTRAPLQGSHRYYDPFRHAGAYATPNHARSRHTSLPVICSLTSLTSVTVTARTRRRRSGTWSLSVGRVPMWTGNEYCASTAISW